ncbi:hypothetical protein P43SY_011508 [Pythium insidiosum]|uniref:Amino acid transporter transmembrane domain-containing protein n=1 Tax=Pythium insidiosum TaxID=114742 RepID=A0AAD5L8B7_PYTIN|nr:hypothetical protein P43SY_011508 [Pythium insidiosum]
MPVPQAVAMVVVVGACMASTALALLHAHVHVAQKHELSTFVGAGRNVASYRSVAIEVAGPRFGDAVSVVMAVGIFGGCVGVIRIVRDMMPHMTKLLYGVFYPSRRFDELSGRSQQLLENALLWGTFLVVVFPLCSLKALSGLRIPNCVGFVFSLVLIGAVVYRSETHDTLDVLSGRAPIERSLRGASDTSTISTAFQFSRFAQSVSIYSYAFTMHLNLLPLFVQLRGSFDSPLQESAARMTRCIACVTSLCVALYITFGVFAARLYGATTRGNVLVNLVSDSFMQLPLIAVFITVLVSFPPLFHPGRCIVEELIHRRPAADLPTRSHVQTAAILLLAELFVAIWVPGIEVVFALVGASTTVLICYVFPVVMFSALWPWRSTGVGWASCILLCGIVAFVAVMGIQTITFLLSS